MKNAVAEKLLHYYKEMQSNHLKRSTCFIGFDGFVDKIMEAVETRTGISDYIPMQKMEQFGNRILQFAGKSCNIELICKTEKVGGNAPIMTLGLLEAGHRIAFCGAIGSPSEIEPLFLNMASRCEEVFPLCSSGHSDALEFLDGKIILGKHDSIIHINFDLILNRVGKEKLIEFLEHTNLFVCVNWTMLPLMTEIWEKFSEDILPLLSFRLKEKPRWMFVDLADPAKRTDDHLIQCLRALKKMNQKFQIILGLNEAEALRIGAVLGMKEQGGTPESIVLLAEYILKTTELYSIIIHATRFAVGAENGETKIVDGPYIAKPVLTTGAGDNFNAGFCNALLYQLSLEERLYTGVFTSGFYVKKGRSPTIPELAEFLCD